MNKNKKTRYHGVARQHLLRILTVVLMFVAIPLQMFAATKTEYQGVKLTEPKWDKSEKVYLITNRNELLWWAINDNNYDIKLMADINVQGEGKKLLQADGKTLAMNPKNIVAWPYVYYRSSGLKIVGNNHVISGIYQKGGYGIDDDDKHSADCVGKIKSYDYVGFISWTATQTKITDLNIADSYLEGKYAGGFMGQKDKNGFSTALSEYKNCSFRGYVKGEVYAGGFTGWYRTDGQDVSFYRCFNYGTIESGSSLGTNRAAGAGGLIGYLDITHTTKAKAHTDFNRCVNYGSVTCLTPGGNVGGIIGKIYENNSGKREWRFCFNLGDVTKYDQAQKALKGSGLIGNYQNTNGKSLPKILGCGNARKADTGALIDSLSWYEYDNEHIPFSIVGAKTNSSYKYYSSIDQDDSWASWWTSNAGIVIGFSIGAAISLLTFGTGTAMGLFAGGIATFFGSMVVTVIWDAIVWLFINIFLGIGTGAITMLIGSAIGSSADALRIENLSKAIAAAPVSYADKDVRTATFAYDANLMMQADSIGGEENTDKSPLFKQHINLSDPSQNDSIPTVITDFSSNADRLYFGYDRCNRTPITSNDPNLDKNPRPHTFDEHGECTYCHFRVEPLEAIYQADGQVDYYAIKTQAQLDYLASAFNGDNEDAYKLYKGASFKLMNDIEFSDGSVWSPIGSCSMEYGKTDGNIAKSSSNWHHFTGKFDGQGFTIKGLRTNGNTNYAGLFGYVDGSENVTSIKNVTLSNCVFVGNVAGSIAGCVNTEKKNDASDMGKLQVNKVCADSMVVVASTCKDSSPYAGGLFGIVNRASDQDLTVSYSYSNAVLILVALDNTAGNLKTEDVLGNFAGAYHYQPTGQETIPTFQHCYYGGTSFVKQIMVMQKGKVIGKQDIDDCYSLGEKKEEMAKGLASYYVPANYMTSGRLAFDLMKNSKVTEDGVTTYFFTQKGNYPVLTNTKQPTLCKVKVGMSTKGIQMQDTIINTNDAHLKAPIQYAGEKFDKALLYGWDNENCEGETVSEGQLNDFSDLYKAPTRYYAIILNPKEISPILNLVNEIPWKGAGVLAGYQQTNILKNLYLVGANAWSVEAAPQCIDGTNNTIMADLPLINNTHESISAARKLFRSSSNRGARAASLSDDATLQNMRVQTDTLTKDVLSKKSRKLYLKNLILQPRSNDADKVILDWNSETQKENNDGYDFKNIICQKMDSTSVTFYKDGSDVMTTTFSDADKDNDYEHILGYLLSNDGMLDVFGLRLSGKNEKVAGKLGFASEESKHVYRATLYNQSTGIVDGEVLMNYDGDVTFEVKGNKLGAMHKGLPDGTFAVLPLTKEELGDKFPYLGKNVITKDGQAACIRLEEGKTDGFAYPSCFDDDKDLILSANRAEYVRKVHRDGLHESIYLPCAFNSVEFDEDDFGDDDQIDISFLGFSEKDGLTENGKSINLTSLRSYYAKKYEDGYDPSQDIDSTDIFRSSFYAGIPYMITLKCKERTDELSTVTFVGTNGEYGIGFLREENPVDPTDLCAPLYGLFHTKTAGEVANGMKIFGLDVFTDETTGNLYDKFVRANDTDRLDAFRCFIATNSSLVGDDISILVDEGTSTGIKDVNFSALQKNGRIFDLSGRRVTKKTPRNIYIQNGKKVINF